MPLLVIAIGIAILLFLILGLRINAFIALILVALGVGVGVGMTPIEALDAVQKGVGGTLGSLALILGFGAMLGGLIAESGAAHVISKKLIGTFGLRHLPWAMVLTGFIVGIPMFYSVAFLVVIPIIFAVASETKMPLLYVAIPIIAALSVTHGFLPPHPAPTTIVEFYGADMQLTLLYGLALAIPTVILAGVVFGNTFKKFHTPWPDKLFKRESLEGRALPSFGISVFTALIPVLLMGLSAVAKLALPKENMANQLIQFIGDPIISLLIAVLIAVWTLGMKSGKSLAYVMADMAESVKPIAIIMLIIAGGGAFKEVLVASGTSDYIVGLMKNVSLSPLVMAWCIAAALRIALGSATVAALTAAGIVQPLVASGHVNAELLVLATGAGSLTCSQVNDTGFWLFKEYFNLSISQTLKSWTLMETIVSVVGLVGCLLLDMVV
ncbi:MAG: gluconate permease [Lewinellaceae bacterium]|nr:gluconate permease [Saprospiraceae bacterium]MCB9340804.1 gluconate permease [Lewinellaceae bacterium]